VSDVQSSCALVYLDTNILAYLNEGEIFNFLPSLETSGSRVVTSDIALSELRGGIDTKVIKDHNFLFVLSDEPMFPEGKVNFYSSLPSAPDDIETEPIERFLRGMLRSAAGSESIPDLNVLLRDGLSEVTQAVSIELPEGADPRLKRQLEVARTAIYQKIELLPELPLEFFSSEDLKVIRSLPKKLGNIRPPGILGKISRFISESEVGLQSAEWLANLAHPLRDGEDVKSRIQELCFALVIIGFARDRQITKYDPEKSEAGARSQFNDISHICSGSTCAVFLTADRRCAKLAYAAYESLGLRTAVALLQPFKDGSFNLREIGVNFWP
jgi:hypothetical protein